MDGQWVNIPEEEICDPTNKVARPALQIAASVATMFMTTEAVVADIQRAAIMDEMMWKHLEILLIQVFRGLSFLTTEESNEF